jgi:hypothetical protein
MRMLLVLAALVLLCGCVGVESGGKDVEVVDVEGARQTTTTEKVVVNLPVEDAATTTSLQSTTTTVKPTTTTVKASVTTITTTSTMSTTTTSTTTSTTKSTTTTTTIKCSGSCYDIKMPSEKTCANACCNSPDSRCEYFGSFNGGPTCRCR